MGKHPVYTFQLPSEEQVIQRNRTITPYYAQLYQNQPTLYKWAGMAAFASFHIGHKLQFWNWDSSGIKSFADTCQAKNGNLEDDFQGIRIINNRIFTEIGRDHLRFLQLPYSEFHAQLIYNQRNPIIIEAFAKLYEAKIRLQKGEKENELADLIWEANTDILWHEQSEVVQPLFDKLSDVFSLAMSLFATFDYGINHHSTRKYQRSRFILFMLWQAGSIPSRKTLLPEVTDLNQRWYWITQDLLKNWRRRERKQRRIQKEITFLAKLEERNLKF